MLVLSRRRKEKVVIPTLGITIEVVAIKPGVVRLGIEAPPDVPILRQELLGRAAAPGRGNGGPALQPCHA
jgi:carbon storage regulator CsrA